MGGAPDGMSREMAESCGKSPRLTNYSPRICIRMSQVGVCQKQTNIIEFPKAKAKSLTKRTLAVGDYLAELYVDTRSAPPLYHYIVTRKDSAEILGWGQERSVEAAERSALDKIADMNAKSAGVG